MATVNYSWTLPTVGASVNTWGTLLNTIIDDIDAKMVSKTATQTLTNKTLTAPVINGFTGDTSVINIGSGQLVKDTSGNLGLGATPQSGGGTARWVTAGSDAGSTYSGGFVSAVGSTAKGYVYYDNISSVNTFVMQAAAGVSLGFRANAANVNQMTLDTSGNLLVKKTALSNSSRGAYIRADNGNGGSICATGDGTTGAILFLGNEEGVGAQRFIVFGNGDVQNLNNSYGAISDIKLKQDITDATPKLAKLLKVHIVNYKFKADPDGIKQIGVIAQELEEISPGLIEETPDFEDVILTREVEKTVPVTVKKEVTTELVRLEVIDGVAVQKVIGETAVIDEPVVDEYPVFDGDGNPVMEVVADAAGDAPAVLRQKIHTVPRMETVVDKEEYTERRLTGTTTKSVKYSIFVPMLIKALQEHVEETRTGFALRDETIKALTARLAALEAA